MNSAEFTIYVSLQGCDDWSGTLSSPSPGNDDGPHATIGKAQEKARDIDKAGLKAVRIILCGGTYFLEQPLHLDARDSGTLNCPVIYEAWPGERPIVSAGVLISGWKETTRDGRRTWIAPAPSHRFHNLWANGERRIRPRYPKDSLLRTEGPMPGSFYEGTNEFHVGKEKVRGFIRQDDVEFVYFAVWTESRLPIRTIDHEKGVVHTHLRSAMNACEVDCSSHYYYDNVFEELCDEGQWYLDHGAGEVYYLPYGNETLENTHVVAAKHVHALEIAGTPEDPVSHIKFAGISFCHTEWWRTDKTEIFRWDVRDLDPPCDVRVVTLADDKAADHQAAISCEAALDLIWAKHCHFTNCSVSHTGSYGISLGPGCSHNAISGCLLSDHGGGGIKIGTQHMETTEAAGFNTVCDCEIRDCAEVFHSAVGLWIGHSAHNHIVHNSIHDMSYTGISIGWVWGYGPSGAYCNLIEYNEIYNIAINGWMHDLSGIYMLGVSPGTIVRNNHIHHVGKDNNVIGIYTDAGSSFIRWENNIVDHADAGYLHSVGKNNIIINNIFAHFNHGLIRGRDESPDLSFIAERNIFYSHEKEMMLDWQGHEGYVFRTNLYWCREGVVFIGGDFQAWQARGQDTESLVADPLFVDPEGGNFSLALNSPALLIGFVPFDLSDVGPRETPGACPSQ